MKSKLSLRSLAKAGLKIIPLVLFLSACSSSTSPSFLKEDVPQAVQDICKKEYELDISSRLVGSTLWIYLPLEGIISKPEKPEKYTERFLLDDKKNLLEGRVLNVNYLVRLTEEKEKDQETALDKSVNKKIFNIMQVIRRVLFSVDPSQKDTPLFFCIVTADIKNGFEIRQTFYVLDLKKISYGIISQTEYQHRIVQDSAISPLIIGDQEGSHLFYRDITLDEFIADQIQSRIKLKFQRPEVERNADIDQEVLKVVSSVLNAYEFKDFNFAVMNNLVTGKKNILNQRSAMADLKE